MNAEYAMFYMSKTFSKRLALLRTKAGLTQQELASRAGMSISHLNRLENDQDKNPRKKTIDTLSSVLGVDPSALLYGVSKKERGEEEFEPVYMIPLLSGAVSAGQF
ncbi:MAG TPA: hypothetical protein DF383_13270 [Deltaproteobacteria bacterium]|nr:hypothetical protein [Deltaproteobacteria bacterium]